MKDNILSIIKWEGKYFIYFPHLTSAAEKYALCRWWGKYDTFDECFDALKERDNEYDHLTIDPILLRKRKMNKIWGNVGG